LSPLSSRIFINTLESPYVKYLGWHGLISEIDQKIVAELELFANRAASEARVSSSAPENFAVEAAIASKYSDSR
jgi:hypothetical protein